MNLSNAHILIYQISVTHDGCQPPVPSFTGRLGLYIEGSVSPPISGVNIKVVAAGDSHNAPLKKGDVAFETSTEPDGTFVAGPLYDDIDYTIDASKVGPLPVTMIPFFNHIFPKL